MRAAVFAGTTEGREICEYLSGKGIWYTAFTATELGAELLPDKNVHIGRLNDAEMSEILYDYDVVIDATHPYAKDVTKNIKLVCRKLNKRCIRLLREESRAKGIYVKNISEAVNFLKDTEGKIFVSTGGKEAEKYTDIDSFSSRVRIRVLDILGAEEKCKKLGFLDIISSRGPYTIEENIRHFSGCQWLVTKSSGSSGGFEEKLTAADKLGMKTIIIERPQEMGFTMNEVKKEIDKIFITEPLEIENRSLQIIDDRLGQRNFSPLEREIVKRVIHTTADFDYADNLIFSEGAVQKAVELLKSGVSLITDTNMSLMGINKRILESLGGRAYCFMADEDVADESKKRGITRAAAAMEKAAKLNEKLIIVCGNAPTALIAVDRLIKERRIKPEFIIAVPVGFVNVVEAKELIIGGEVPNITAVGNKGGSGVAAAIVNALLYNIKR